MSAPVHQTAAMAPVYLTSMPQLSQAQCPDDDWTGLQDRAERRKRQNRLNVRAHRKRKLQEQAMPQGNKTPIDDAPEPPIRPKRRKDSQSSLRIKMWTPDQGFKGSKAALPRRLSHAEACGFSSCSVPSGAMNLVKRLDIALQLPHPLPLSITDLLPLIQLNLFRAALSNAVALSLGPILKACSSILPDITLFPSPSQLPPSLQPTEMQRKNPHDLCVDLMPCARMRNNAIRFAHKFSYADFARDAIGENITETGEPMLIVWTDPWDPASWEMTEAFLRRWGFLVKDCHEMFAASNRWRALRGKGPLVFE